VKTLADLQQWEAASLVLQAAVRHVFVPADCNDHPTHTASRGVRRSGLVMQSNPAMADDRPKGYTIFF